MKRISSISFVLTNLIEINNQRAVLYKSLVDQSDDMELKLLFLQYAIQAQTFVATLNKWGCLYGAELRPNKKRGIFNDAAEWLRGLFSTGGRRVLLNQCESMEQKALKLYRAVVAMSFLPLAAIADVNYQADQLEKVTSSLRTVITGGSANWRVAFS
jgi:hypothetical protein